MTDHLDPGEWLAQNQAVSNYVAERDGWKRRLTVADADTLHNLVRLYPTLTPDTSVGIIASGMAWDDLWIKDIVQRDAAEADNFLQRNAKRLTRSAFIGVESWWQEGIPRQLRTGVRMYQGEDPLTAWRRAGSSELSRIVRQGVQGEPINVGSGWLNRSTQAEDLPGFQDLFGASLQEGNTLADSLMGAREETYAKYGTPITEDYTRVAESTLIHKTQNGVTASSPVSLGRLAAITVSMPGTIPFQTISGFIDFNARILIDPIEMPIRELVLAHKARKTVVPQRVDDVVRRNVDNYLRNELDVQLMPSQTRDDAGKLIYGEAHKRTRRNRPDTGVPEVNLFPEDLEIGGSKLLDKNFNQYDSGYAEARILLDDIAQQRYGMSYDEYLFKTYGDGAAAKWDETITHEFIHSERQFTPRKDKMTGTQGETLYELDYDSFSKEALEYAGYQADELLELKKVEQSLEEAKKLKNLEITEARKRISLADPEDAKAVEKANVDLYNRQAEYADLDELQLAALKKQIKVIDDIDAETLIEFDATFRAGQRLLIGESTMKRIRNAALNDAGLRSSWRPWLQPRMIEDWLHTSAGQRTIRFLANNNSITKQRKVLRGQNIPREVQEAVLAADNEIDVIKAITPILGIQINQIPKYGTAIGAGTKNLGATIAARADGNALGPLTRMDFNGGVVGKVRIGLHRIKAKQVKLQLNSFDIERTMDHAEAWLRGQRATDSQIDEVLTMILATGDRGGTTHMGAIYSKIVEIYTIQAKRHGMADTVLESALRDFGEALLNNTEYFIDAAGNKVDDIDDLMRIMYNPIQAKDQPQALFSAIMESQTSQTQWVLPNARVARRSTSHLHQRTQRITDAILSGVDDEARTAKVLAKLFPEGLNDSWGFKALDTAHGIWRDLALLRFGWPARVIPEEMLRQMAAGYSDAVTHPLDYFALMLRHSMNNSVMGDDFASLLTVSELGSGMFRDVRRTWDATKQSWTTVRRGAPGYKEGLAHTFLSLAGDEVGRRIALDGPDAVYVWLATGEGRDVARRIMDAGAGNPLLDLSTPAKTKQFVNRIYAYQTQYTGGSWIRKNAQGKWVDMSNQAIPDWVAMTKQQLVDEINRRRLLIGEAPVTAKATSYTKERWLNIITEETGIPIIKNLDDGLNYHIVEPGNDQLRRIIGEGVNPLDDSRRIIDPQMKIRSKNPDDLTLSTFTDELESIFAELEIQSIDTVRVPRNALSTDPDTGKTAVDAAFEMLMAKPSAYLVRSPFFLQKYSEEMAKVYVFADEGLRTYLLKWADGENASRMFARHIQQQANAAGFRKVPGAGSGRAFTLADDLEMLDNLAKSRSLQATRDLFYDLAERNNITDMVKYIFPFADAWFEVLSRWAKLLFTNVERAPTNWRRFQVGMTNVRKEGYFDEDEYGREVFNWPGAGLMAPWLTGAGPDVGYQTKVGLDQLMFIDPDPRGIMMPGAGFMVQWPASMAQPLLDKVPILRNAVNSFAFGDFQRIEPQGAWDAAKQVLPSWMRQLVTAVFPDENKAEFADDIGMFYEMLLASQNPQWNQDTVDDAKRTMEQARSTVTTLSWLKVIDRIFQPATPSYQAQILNEAIEFGDPMWITALALSREWTATLEIFDDTNMARESFLSRFGLDPLNQTSNTYKIADAPATITAYDFLQNNQELYDVAGSSMMAWIDVPEDDQFFGIAWQRQKARGQRVILAPEQRMWVINEQMGWHEWNVTVEAVDAWEADIKANTSPRTHQRTAQMAVLKEYKNRRQREIFETYWAWDNQGDRKNIGQPKRATTEQIWGELMEAGTPGTEAYKVTNKIDPDMSRWVQEFTAFTRSMEEYSLTQIDDKGSNTRTWWLTSTIPEAEQLRQAFVDRMQLNAMDLPEASALRVQYVLERYIRPVLRDFDWDEELWLIPTPIPDAPILPSWDDTIPTPYEERSYPTDREMAVTP